MEIAYIFLIVIWVAAALMFVIGIKSDGASADVLQVVLCVGSVSIALFSLLGIVISSKTVKTYRSEYNKLIQSIDKDKTKVFKENDEITDIYITVNGEEHHFKFKEENNNE